MNGKDYINELFGSFTGNDGKKYLCTKCRQEMDRVVVQTAMNEPRKLFYCKNKHCSTFGNLTVVAIKS